MNPKAKWVLIIGMFLLMAYVVYGSMARVQAECEVCVEFNGRTECARGAGADEQEAENSAQMAACGVMAVGMEQSIRCQNAIPVARRCTTD